jgi:hydroxypyruvate isomerase
MHPVICIEMVYTKDDFARRIEQIANHGFTFVEFWGWRDKDIASLQQVCERTGVQIVNFSAQRVGNLVDIATHQSLLNDYADALKVAQLLGTKTLMALTNELGDGGVVINSYDDLSVEEKRLAVVTGLKKMLAMTPSDGKLVLESLNTVKDHVGYFLSSISEAASLVREIGDGRLGVLCDLYHQGMMDDDLIADITENYDAIGYYHVADFPGRHEPGTGTGDWKTILRTIKDTGYTGYVGFEYAPAGDDDVSLQAIAQLWESL